MWVAVVEAEVEAAAMAAGTGAAVAVGRWCGLSTQPCPPPSACGVPHTWSLVWMCGGRPWDEGGDGVMVHGGCVPTPGIRGGSI